MKRTLIAGIILFLTTSIHAQPKIDFREKGAPVPPFAIEQTNGKVFTNTVLKSGKPVLMIIFSPECDHCERAMDTLQGMTDNLKNTQLVLVTEAAHKAKLEAYLSKSGLGKNPAFKNVGSDKGNLIYDIYAYGMLPQFNIYNAKHKLVKTFTGIFPLDSLKMFLPPAPPAKVQVKIKN